MECATFAAFRAGRAPRQAGRPPYPRNIAGLRRVLSQTGANSAARLHKPDKGSVPLFAGSNFRLLNINDLQNTSLAAERSALAAKRRQGAQSKDLIFLQPDLHPRHVSTHHESMRSFDSAPPAWPPPLRSG